MSLTRILREVRSCQVCLANLPFGPRPVLQLASTARILIIGQAPGRKVHQSGIPWNDASGDRLRDWLRLDRSVFYDREYEFDFKSDSFEAKAVWSQPKPLQKPHPPVMNAGGSTAAQDFTTRNCDMNFVHLKDRANLETGRREIAQLKERARLHGNQTRIWVHVYVVCRDTEKEAKDYLHHYVYEKGDWHAATNLLRIFGVQSESYDPKSLEDHKAHFIAGHGGYPLVGTAEQIADELGKLADIGVDGCLISRVDYKNELRQWNARVLPLLIQSGLRQPFEPQ